MKSLARSPRVLIMVIDLVITGLAYSGASGVALAERLPIKSYTSADGLGSSFVNYLMRDSRGFMWFCTRDGLSRFDGTRLLDRRSKTIALPSKQIRRASKCRAR